MGVSLLLLVVVLLLPNEDGIKRWIDLGFFQFQPSEVAKFMLILFLAKGLDKDYKKLVSSKLSKESFAQRIYELSGNKILISQGTTTLFYYLFVVVVIAGLVALESHLSGTILILGIGVIMLWLGEGRAKWFAIGATIAIVAVIIVVKEYDNIPLLRDYMAERIKAWLDKDYEPTGARWQTNQSLYAIGSGGFFGSGLGNSKEKYLYVSEPQNDFIFAIVCEELGFVGATAILLLYGALIVRGIIIGMHAKDRFGSLVAFGMVFQLGLQVALNVAVVTDTVPNTGIGLPFFSYGGSSMWLCLAEMGAVLSVSRQANMPKVYTFKNIKVKR
jgi:cell division protein FtsW